MAKRKGIEHLSTWILRVWRGLLRHPVEMIVLLHATAAATVSGTGWWQLPASYAAFAAVAALCLSLQRGRRWATVAYWAVLPLYALCALVPCEWHRSTAFAILNALLPAVYLVARGCTGNERFATRLLSLVRSAVVAVGVGGLMCLLMTAIYYSTEALFGFTLRGSESFILSLSFVLITPLLFIGMEDGADEPTATRLEEAVVNYVLTPALLIYNVVLYVYVVWIAVRWQLPEGSVATMVCVFGAVAMIVAWLRPRLERRPVEWYFRWFGLIALPLVALLWVAVGYRVGQYGLTVDRCLLTGVGVVFTLYCLLSLLRWRRLAWSATALAVLLGVVLAVGGPLSARQMSVRSQLGIARQYAQKIGVLNADGTIMKTSDMEGDTANRVEHRAIYQAIKYIQSDLHDTALCREQLGLTSGEYLEGLSRPTFDYATAWRVEDIEEPDIEAVLPSIYIYSTSDETSLDISEYNQMMSGGRMKNGRIAVPGGSINADSVLATQLALIGCTPQSNLEGEWVRSKADLLCTYRSPDGRLLIVFRDMTLQQEAAGYCISDADVRYVLKK